MQLTQHRDLFETCEPVESKQQVIGSSTSGSSTSALASTRSRRLCYSRRRSSRTGGGGTHASLTWKMLYRTYLPAPDLRAYVKCYWILRSDRIPSLAQSRLFGTEASS
jgi:hypothetical protein